MSNELDFLFEELKGLQDSIDTLHQTTSSLNDHYESLKSDIVDVGNEINPDVHDNISGIHDHITIKVQHVETMINNLIDEERLQHIANALAIHKSMVK